MAQSYGKYQYNLMDDHSYQADVSPKVYDTGSFQTSNIFGDAYN